MATRIRELIWLGWESKWGKAGRGFLRRQWLMVLIVIVYVISGSIDIALGLPWLDAQAWTGFHGRRYGDAKTLWDWLDLLIVPIVLAIGAYAFDRRAKNRDQAREDAAKERDRLGEEANRERDRQMAEALREREIKREDTNRQEEILQNYLDYMSQLLLHERLREDLLSETLTILARERSENNQALKQLISTSSPVIDVARVQTLSVLRRLTNTARRRELVDFLLNSGFYRGHAPLFRNAKMDRGYLEKMDLEGIDMSLANLAEANLAEANLARTNLVGANLAWANLVGANLVGANLARTNLAEANLLGANLLGANLEGANLLGAQHLAGADLAGANLARTDLAGADLAGANLVNANLEGTNLEGANLLGANLLNANLKGAHLEGANLLGVNLMKANLVGAEGLEKARFDETTVLPNRALWHEGVDWTDWTKPKGQR